MPIDEQIKKSDGYLPSLSIFVPMDTEGVYQTTIAALRRCIEQHPVPAPRRASVAAFCDVHGFSRQNLTEIFGGRQELSVSLFMRLAAALGKSPGWEIPPGLENLSLHTWLKVQNSPVTAAMYGVNFS